MDDQTEDYGAAEERSAPPAVDLAPLEQRINRITEAVTALSRRDQHREAASAADRVRQYEGQLSDAIRRSQAAIDTAERQLAQAHENGDAAEIARATRRVTDAVAEREAVRLEKRDFDRAKQESERRQAGSSGARGQSDDGADDVKDTTNLNDWKSRNSQWYGVDGEMTKAAHEIDRAIRQAGVIPVGSQDYFRAIDRQMAQKYPDKFRSAPTTSGGSSAQAGGQRLSSGHIPRDVVETWGRMGIAVDDDKTLERMVKNRERLVAKGILPEKPAYGRVI